MRKLKLSYGADDSPLASEPVFEVWLEIPWSELRHGCRKIVTLRCGLNRYEAEDFWDRVAPMFNLTDRI